MYEQGLVDCRQDNCVGFKGLKLQYFNKAKTAQYNESQAIAIFNLNPITQNLQQMVTDITQMMKDNPDVYFLCCFDEVATAEQYQLLSSRYQLTQLNIIQDIPSTQKPAWSAQKTRSYSVEIVKDRQYDIQNELSIMDKLKILSSMDKVE